MNIIEIINKKKNNKSLTKDEIDFFVNAFVDESIPDYQVSSLLMAILLRGMDEEETSNLTSAMINSGGKVDLSSISGIKSDKHSTGGVGDKVSLVLGPLVTSCGVKLSKMSGKGLGHTGGTLDKLQSIPGFNIELSEEDFGKAVKDYGIAIISQTKNLVPADKKLYSLRDVTGTVDSIPLIASSIMSKKLASGSDTILLDVKCGTGAFMQDFDSAKILAKSMVSIGKNHGKDTRAVISNMNEPLGYSIGNSLEVIEALETLKGKGPKDLEDLCLYEGAIILIQNGIVDSIEEGKAILYENLRNNKALEKFKDLVKAQSGDERVVDDYSILPISKYKTEIKSPTSAYIKGINPLSLGNLSSDLGAGRKALGDIIDHGIGLVLKNKTGDFVEKGQVLLTVYHNKDLSEDFIRDLVSAFDFSEKETLEKTLIYDYIY